MNKQQQYSIKAAKGFIRTSKKMQKLYEQELLEKKESLDVFDKLKKKTEINKFINDFRSFMKQDIQKENSTFAEYLENAIYSYMENEFIRGVFLKNPQDKDTLEKYKDYISILQKQKLISSRDIKEMNVPKQIHEAMDFSLTIQRNHASRNAESYKQIENYFKRQKDIKEKKEANIAKFMEEVIPKR